MIPQPELERFAYPGGRAVYEAPRLHLPPAVVGARPSAVLNRFEYKHYALRPFHLPVISRLAGFVVASWRTQQPVREISLVGHTDSTGPSPYNLNLGRSRALAAQRSLLAAIQRLSPFVSRRIPSAVLSAGASRPVGPNTTP